MIQTIFEVMNKEKIKEEIIHFDKWINNGDLRETTTCSKDVDICIHISQDALYDYYLGTSTNHKIIETIIYLKKR